MHAFAGLWMIERKVCRVQEEPPEMLDGLSYLVVCDRIVAAFVIDAVADDRMIYRGKVYANLVRASGLDLNVEEREFLESLANLPER